MTFTGPGVRRRVIGGRTLLNFHGSDRAIFEGAFFVDLQQGRATIAPGLVNALLPSIGGVPITGSKLKPIPALDLTKPVLDADGRGFVCVECGFVTPDEADEAARLGGPALEPWSVKTAEIVQVACPDSDDGLTPPLLSFTGGARNLAGDRARWPLALLRLRDTGTLDVFQIIYFSLRHRTALQADGRGAQRHFFF